MTFDGFISYSHAADGRLAPAVQRGLHRLARPWHRRRALWIFRDQTGLSVTPALWSSIQEALDGSEWFVLLASPDAARSPWVNREIEHWIATKPAERILPVVTDGTWDWDAERGDLAADSTAVPEALRGVFAEEPLYLDLRWAREDGQLTLQHTRFRDAIAQLAAPMHGVSKDELEGEDVRQHRRGRRLRRVAVAAVALLTVVASLAGTLAGHNADLASASATEARRQEQAAAEQRGNAERSAAEAQRQLENANRQEERARSAATETERQEQRAQEQQAAAERAAAEAERQQRNARRQQELSQRARALAEEQKALAREQSELARESATETARQRLIAERQQQLAEQAAAEAERQRQLAKQQQRMAEEAAAEARRQEEIARVAAEEARRQQENAAEQQRIAIGRRLLNQAKAAVGDDPETALRLGVAAQQLQPGSEARGELAGLVTSTRRVGTAAGDFLFAAYGPGDLLVVVEYDYSASLWNTANRAAPIRVAEFAGAKFLGNPVFSPDGKTLAVTGWGMEPVIYDVSDPTAPAFLGAIPASFSDTLTFSPDGRTLAAVDGIDGGWSLWDMTNRARPALLTRQTTGDTSPVTFSPDSRTLVTTGAPAIVYDISDRTRPTEVSTVDGNWIAVAYSPTRPILATSDDDGNLTFWLMDDRTKPRKISTTPGGGLAGSFSRDGLILATGDLDGTARLWDMSENTPVHMADVDDRSGIAGSATFSSDGRILATTGITGTLSLWTVAAHGDPKVLGRAVRVYTTGLAAALTPDAKRLTTVHVDGSATIWDRAVERATVRVHSTSLRSAAVSSDGLTVAALAEAPDGSVRLTDLTDPARPVNLGVLPDGPHHGAKLEFGPDGQTLAVVHGYDVALWDLTDRRNPVRQTAFQVDDMVNAVEFSPDGRTLAIATGRTITLRDLTGRTDPVTLRGHTDIVIALAFSPDGRTLATGGLDRTATLWTVADRTRARRQAILGNLGAPVWSVAFAPDGRTLATGTDDDAAALWDVTELAGPTRVATLKRTDFKSKWLFFHPDGHTLTSSGTNFSRTRAVHWDYSALNALRADPTTVACGVLGSGLSAEEWAAFVPEVGYRPTCTS